MQDQSSAPSIRARHSVRRIQFDAPRRAEGHEHVDFVETDEPDAGETRWRCVDVIAAIRAGERFVLADKADGRESFLDPALCPRCPRATLQVSA